MKKSLWLFTGLLMLVIMQGSLATTYCYQETANVSTSCGGLSTGTYLNSTRYFYINYTKPLSSSNLSLWMVRQGNYTTSYNLSLASCWGG